MSLGLRILIAQINPKVGAIKANLNQISAIIDANQDSHDLIIFPELSLCGYPCEDLILRQTFQEAINDALVCIQNKTQQTFVIIGHPSSHLDKHYNAASIFHEGRQVALYYKQKLPNYGVFDEKRVFTEGPQKACIFTVKGFRIGLCICEDLWQPGPGDDLVHNIDVLVSINASPFDTLKQHQRETLMRYYASQGISVIYANMVGGQDELVFDGQSFVLDAKGKITAKLSAFKEEIQTVTLFSPHSLNPIAAQYADMEILYKALVTGVRDYINKNDFPGVLVGLSGGIDSALTLCIAVDALGPSRVEAILMPSRYSAPMSLEDALDEANRLQVKTHTLSIEPLFIETIKTLNPLFENYAQDSTEENIQARLRGLLIMAISNKTGNLVLTTSNKSETAVGYSTLYGDMAGGFCVLKDVYKTDVYKLADYRNQIEEVIPKRVILRPPSAELAENQTDQDNLPDYPTLDAIIHAYVEKGCSIADIINQGFNEDIVKKVIQLIIRNEYKRRQAPPGPKITPKCFGKDWRYPLTSGFIS